MRPVAVEQRNQMLWGQRKKKGGREIERETKKERDHTGDKKKGTEESE